MSAFLSALSALGDMIIDAIGKDWKFYLGLWCGFAVWLAIRLLGGDA